MLRAMGAHADHVRGVRHRVQVSWGGCDHIIEIIGASNAEARKRVQGATLAGVIVDELVELPMDFWRMVWTRLRDARGTKCWATCNPAGPRHPVKLHIADRIADWHGRLMHFEQSDNPGLKAEDAEAMASALRGTADYDRLILGHWSADEGVIFESPPIAEPPPGAQPDQAACGVDWAGSGTFAGVLLLRYGDTWFVASERVHHTPTQGAMHEVEQVRRTQHWIGQHTALPCPVFGDPTTPEAAQDCFRGTQTWWLDADNKVDVGIYAVKAGFHGGRLKVSAACSFLLAELAAYAWDPAAQEKGLDKPIKRADHSVDAMRYAWVGVCEQEQRDVVVESAVWA